jgi:hypothetical protein
MNVLNRTTKQFIQSANTPDYPVQDWIHNPDMLQVVGYESKYWIITGDNVYLMDQAARNAVDAAELVAQKDAEADNFDAAGTYFKAAMEVMIDGFNVLRAQFNTTTRQSTQLTDTNLAPYTLEQLKTAVRAKLDG